MKHLAIIISLVLFSGAVHAQFRSAEITMKDGSKRAGLAEMPKFSANNVKFMAEGSNKEQKIKAKDVQTLVFKDEARPVVMEYMNCRVNESITAFSGWGWLTLVASGPVSTYKGELPVSPSMGVRYAGDGNEPYCYRDGEKYATNIPVIGFATKMAKYFEDYPDLSAKIKDKADGYKRENIDAIIAEYNAWKAR